MLALYTGARLNELCQLLVNDIKFDGDILTVVLGVIYIPN